MATDDYGWGPELEPLTELQVERAAILEFCNGCSREEAERLAREMHPSGATYVANHGKPEHGLTSKVVLVRSSHHDDHSDLIDHNLPLKQVTSCDSCVSSELSGGSECDPLQEEQLASHEPLPSACAKPFFKGREICDGKVRPVEATPSVLGAASPPVPDYGNTHFSGMRPCSSSEISHISEPAFELPLSREQEVRKILESRFECPSEIASLLAPECLSACLQRGLDPITVMADIAIAWRIARHEPGSPPIQKVGTWIAKRISWWKDPSAPYGGTVVTQKPIRPEWAELRRRIIAGAVEGGEVRGADLRDYWDHQMAVGKLHCLDSQISHAIAALERAGCCHRHGNALSITSEVLRIEPGQRHKVSRAQGMERLQRAVQRRWPNIGEQWQAIIDEILCNLKWWRGMLGEGLGGLADWIDSEAGQNREKDDQIEYRARIKGVRVVSEPPKKMELVNQLPVSSIRNEELELTRQETLFLESEKRRIAQVI